MTGMPAEILAALRVAGYSATEADIRPGDRFWFADARDPDGVVVRVDCSEDSSTALCYVALPPGADVESASRGLPWRSYESASYAYVFDADLDIQGWMSRPFDREALAAFLAAFARDMRRIRAAVGVAPGSN